MNHSSGAVRFIDRSAPSASNTAAAAGLVVVHGRTVVNPGRSTVDASLTTTTTSQRQQQQQQQLLIAAMISTQSRHGDDVIASRRHRRSDSTDSRWFVRPIHLHSDDETSSEAAAILFAADRNVSTSSVRMENDVSATSRSTSSNPPTGDGTASGRNSIDGLLKTYFPATIVASRLRESIAVDAESPASPRQQLQQQQQQTVLPEPTTPPNESETDSPSKRTADCADRTARKPRLASGAGGASRPSSTKSSSSSASNGSFDRMYLNDSQSGKFRCNIDSKNVLCVYERFTFCCFIVYIHAAVPQSPACNELAQTFFIKLSITLMF